MKKRTNRTKKKRNSSKVRKLKKGRRLAVSMVTRVAGIDNRVARVERIAKKILDNLGDVGEYIKASEGRLQDLELTRWERFKNFVFGRKG